MLVVDIRGDGDDAELLGADREGFQQRISPIDILLMHPDREHASCKCLADDYAGLFSLAVEIIEITPAIRELRARQRSPKNNAPVSAWILFARSMTWPSPEN